jgi:hypothetical protein
VILHDRVHQQSFKITSGGLLMGPNQIQVRPDGMIVVTHGGGLALIDPLSGTQQSLIGSDFFDGIFGSPLGVALDLQGRVLVGDGSSYVHRLDFANQIPDRVADGEISAAIGLTLGRQGQVLIADILGGTVRSVPFNQQSSTLVASGIPGVTDLVAFEDGSIMATVAGSFVGQPPDTLIRISPDGGVSTLFSGSPLNLPTGIDRIPGATPLDDLLVVASNGGGLAYFGRNGSLISVDNGLAAKPFGLHVIRARPQRPRLQINSATGAFTFRAAVERETFLGVQSSTDLQNWTAKGTMASPVGAGDSEYTGTTDQPSLFLRAFGF